MANMAPTLAVVRVRGSGSTPGKIEDTLVMLNLSRKNYGTVISDTPVHRGMINKVKDFVTWGEIDDSTLKELIAQRGQPYLGRLTDTKGKYHYNTLELQGKNYKRYFTLNPPRKGFGRKGIKIAFSAGGALGYRAEKINDLLKRMIYHG